MKKENAIQATHTSISQLAMLELHMLAIWTRPSGESKEKDSFISRLD